MPIVTKFSHGIATMSEPSTRVVRQLLPRMKIFAPNLVQTCHTEQIRATERQLSAFSVVESEATTTTSSWIIISEAVCACRLSRSLDFFQCPRIGVFSRANSGNPAAYDKFARILIKNVN